MYVMWCVKILIDAQQIITVREFETPDLDTHWINACPTHPTISVSGDPWKRGVALSFTNVPLPRGWGIRN